MQHAASMILLRWREELEVFWVRRRSNTSFLSGFHAFPGGLVEDEDHESARDDLWAITSAAIRETQEEVEVELHRERLEYIGHWIAPPYLVRKFDTHYFVYREGELSPVVTEGNEELDLGEWIRPKTALARWRRGEVLLAPPTRAILRALDTDSSATHFPFFGTSEVMGDEPTLSPIRSNLMMIPLRTPTLPPATHTNCYIIGEEALFIVEPASPHPDVMDSLFSYLDERIAGGASLKAILLTHHHHDHIGGVTEMVARYGLPVWAHKETANRVPFKIDRELTDGEIIEADPKALWSVIHTPGHAPGHLCFLEQTTKSMIVGDMVAGLGSILVEPTDGDMTEYLDSLALMRSLEPSCLLPSHGPPIGGADAKLSQYIDHRLDRERSLISALKSGAVATQDLVDYVYSDVPKVLRAGPNGGLAGLSLRSHLNKLEHEGRVQVVGDEWRWRA